MIKEPTLLQHKHIHEVHERLEEWFSFEVLEHRSVRVLPLHACKSVEYFGHEAKRHRNDL